MRAISVQRSFLPPYMITNIRKMECGGHSYQPHPLYLALGGEWFDRPFLLPILSPQNVDFLSSQLERHSKKGEEAEGGSPRSTRSGHWWFFTIILLLLLLCVWCVSFTYCWRVWPHLLHMISFDFCTGGKQTIKLTGSHDHYLRMAICTFINVIWSDVNT